MGAVGTIFASVRIWHDTRGVGAGQKDGFSRLTKRKTRQLDGKVRTLGSAAPANQNERRIMPIVGRWSVISSNFPAKYRHSVGRIAFVVSIANEVAADEG